MKVKLPRRAWLEDKRGQLLFRLDGTLLWERRVCLEGKDAVAVEIRPAEETGPLGPLELSTRLRFS